MKKADLDRYFEKSGDDSITTNARLVENEHGFATFSVNGNVLVIHNEFGDGKYWEEYFVSLARRNNLCIRFITRRSPKAYMRKYKCRIVGYILERTV